MVGAVSVVYGGRAYEREREDSRNTKGLQRGEFGRLNVGMRERMGSRSRWLLPKVSGVGIGRDGGLVH